MRAWRAALTLAALTFAAAGAATAWWRAGWPHVPELLGMAAAALAVAARLVAVGRHRGRTGAHARPPLLAEAREAAVERAADRAETAEIRAVINPRGAAPPAAQAAPGKAGRLPAGVVTATLGIPLQPPYWPRPGRHRAVAAWGAPAGCPDPGRCGASPWCPGDQRCQDPAPLNPLGRTILAPGKIPVHQAGRHEAPLVVVAVTEEEVTRAS